MARASAGRRHETDHGASADGWLGLLDNVARGLTEVVIQSPSAGRVVVISEDKLDRLRQRAEANRLTAASTRLSPRELEVLALAARGETGTAIAATLGLAVNTVAQHLVSARRKLGVRTTREAIARAKSTYELP